MKMMTCGEITQKFNNWSGTNYSRYCDRDYDRLWQQSSVELDPQTRTQLLITLNDKLISDVATIPLIHRARVVGVNNNLKGVNLTAWDSRTWNIHQWEKID